MTVVIEETDDANIIVDKDKFAYHFEIQNDIQEWLDKNIDEDQYFVDTENLGKQMNIGFKKVSDLILFKLSCL